MSGALYDAYCDQAADSGWDRSLCRWLPKFDRYGLINK